MLPWILLWTSAALAGWMLNYDPGTACASALTALGVGGCLMVHTTVGRTSLALFAQLAGMMLALLPACALPPPLGYPLFALGMVGGLMLCYETTPLKVLGLNLLAYWSLCALVAPSLPALVLLGLAGFLLLLPVALTAWARRRRQETYARDLAWLERVLVTLLGVGFMVVMLGWGLQHAPDRDFWIAYGVISLGIVWTLFQKWR